jgi:TonB-dependent SusC/RagA subfamily outer membrane receptor
MKTKVFLLAISFLLSIGGAVNAQTIKGKVTDSKGNPLTGASVTYGKSKKGAAVSDANGEFVLNTEKAGERINVSFIGYKPQDVKVKNLFDGFEVILADDSKSLDDVVVTGYSRSTREKLTGNISTINAETLAQYPGTSVLEVLQGRVAGLSITKSSGLPGATTSINIRGLNSPSGAVGLSAGHSCCGGSDSNPANPEPLIIIDGVSFINQSISPLDLGAVGTVGPLATLSTSDIERIDVLKDADATAIYGSRGANGVILITTKKDIRN